MFGKRIRKDAGDLSLADFESAPMWEFCYDEEGVEGQNECTMRPATLARREVIDPTIRDGLATVDAVAKNGRRFVGAVEVTPGPIRPHEVFLVLDRPVGAVIAHELLERYNTVLMARSPRISFYLGPWPRDPDKARQCEAEARESVGLALRVLGMTAAELFPMHVRPRVKVRGWDDSCEVAGFYWLDVDAEKHRLATELAK